MQPRQNINDASRSPGENPPMFLHQLSSSFLPRSRPAFCRAAFRSSSCPISSPSLPPPHPWSVGGVPHWPPGPPLPRPAAHQVSSGVNVALNPRSVRSFCTSAAFRMEQPGRGPPHKRRRSLEEKRSVGEREGHRGGAGATGDTDGGSKREHRHLDNRRENSRGGERTRTVDKDRRDETTNRERSKDPPPPRSRTGAPDTTPSPHKPNPWFKERAAAGGWKPDGPERSFWGRGADDPRDLPPNHWKMADASRQPPPPGTRPPVRQQKVLKPLQRRWETTACNAAVPPPGGNTAFDFSVMSYNILSQDLLEDNGYLYRHCDPAHLCWDHRLPNLLAEIRQHNADILCLQEVQEDHYENQIKPALQTLGYQCEYKKRTGSKPDGCAVVFKSSRLSLLSSNPVEFFRPGDALLDRDNVGLVLLLRPNDSDPSALLCVANTHLLYNPRRGDIKLAQLAILLAEVDRLSRLPDGSSSPVLLCGDFNSTPWSPLYGFLTTGGLDYRGLQIGTVSGQETSPRGQRLLTSPIWSPSLGIDHRCRYQNQPAADSSPSSPSAVEGEISNLTVKDLATKAAYAFNRSRMEHDLKLQSSYQHRLMPGGRPEITTCHSRTAMTVDYILFNPDFPAPPSLPGGRGLRLLGRLSLVGQSELEAVNGLPNCHHSSDHLPLLARFRLRH